MKRPFIRAGLALAGVVASGAALAHPGHEHGGGLAAGFSHPLLGADHLLAMLAVGAWAWQLGGKARWAVPLSFVTLMAGAAALGAAGVAMPMVESGIAASLLVLGLLIACAVRVSPAVGAAIVAVFAIFHGHAHGTEMPGYAQAWQYGAGFLLATAGLHGAGLLLGKAIGRHALWLRASGVLVGLSGAWMLAA